MNLSFHLVRKIYYMHNTEFWKGMMEPGEVTEVE